jgi:nucleotide-binding universal stress UspA family protein
VPLAAASSAAVLVVHALEIGPAFMAAGLIEAYAHALAQTTAAVEEWCEPLRKAGLAYTTVLEEGGPTGVLLHAVRTHGADLLVVGRRTRGDFPGMDMGSAAHRALGFSPCPTVVVPAKR